MRLGVGGGQGTMRHFRSMPSYEENTGTEESVQNTREFHGYLLRYLTISNHFCDLSFPTLIRIGKSYSVALPVRSAVKYSRSNKRVEVKTSLAKPVFVGRRQRQMIKLTCR